MANNVKLILLQDVENLGLAGSEVTVAPGYARNYLIPQGLAAKATPGILRVLAANKEKIEAKRRDELVAAQATAAKPLPRYSPNCLAISTATSSFSFTASNTTLALISLPRRELSLSSMASLLRASLAIPVAEAYCSRHPHLPHPHTSGSVSSR